MNIEKRLIPVNFTKSRFGWKPKAIVLHLMDGTLKGTDSWFRNPKAVASTHYGVGVRGDVYQWVDESNTAWGNGRVYKPTWRLIEKAGINPNLYTISIEHEGVVGHEWTPEQYAADVELIKQIAQRNNIPLDRDHIIIHSEIYAKKPDCTGHGLDINKLLSMLNAKPQNELVKGDKSAAVYWIGNDGKAHAIASWEFFLAFFGGTIRTVPQADMDKIEKGLSFKV